MRHIYRTLTYASFLVATGSFVVDLGTYLRDGAQPVLTQQPDDFRKGREIAKAECDLRIYESAKQRLRNAGRNGTQAWEWLGTDQHYDYFYFFANDKVECHARKSSGPLVAPKLTSEGEMPAETRFAILACLAVMGGCGSGLVAIRRMREKRLSPPDG